jgi:LuxR family maltose regulon positive regulatory protein
MQERNSEINSQSPILTTSLRIPKLHEGLITRPILLGKLDQALEFPLTLVIAPAGFGKTTLLSQWISARARADLRDRVAWVSLESEYDARQFWTSIITSLQEVQPKLGESALASLETSQPPIHVILRALINDIADAAQEFVLILDDYHHIDEPAIHATLSFLIDHLPYNLHLVITSRSQPPLSLARWRASNDLYELREEDLRFTPEEVAFFFNEITGLNLSPLEIAALENRTEGWIAGLQLVALSIQGVDDQSKRSFVSAFTGSQRYILDYLVEEVLEQQPDHLKTFLLRTSILERLSASLCNAVTGRTDGQAILESLEREHLFMISLDQEQRWYRYHHLFKDVLYHRLTRANPDSVLALHRRAMEWFVCAGRTDEAIRQACAAHEWDRAVELIEPAIQATWNRGEIRKIIGWLGRLPDEYLDSHRHLYLYYLRALLHGGQMEEAERQLQKVETNPGGRLHPDSNVDDQLQLGTIYAIRTTIAAVSEEPGSALALGKEALRLLPEENTEIRAYGLNSLGVAQFYLGNMAQAEQIFAQGREMAQQAGNVYSAVAAAAYQAKALVIQGRLHAAERVLEGALRPDNPADSPSRPKATAAGLACAILGNLFYEWNRLEEAEQYLTEAIELGQQLAYGSALWSAYHTLARIRLIHQDQKGAEALVEEAQRYRMSYTVLLPAGWMDAEQAGAELALGRLQNAEHWASTCREEQTASARFVQETEGLLRARLYLRQGKPGQARALLDQLRPITESSDRTGHLIELLALTAMSQHALGRVSEAIDTLQAALRIAEPEGYLRTFVDEGQPMAVLLYQALAEGILSNYIGKLLAAFPTYEASSYSWQNPSQAPQVGSADEQLIEPLSERELEVLQWMAGGASNQEIAEALTIAVTTAKKHVSNIIRKLGVDNRMQAAAKGRNLGLCE